MVGLPVSHYIMGTPKNVSWLSCCCVFFLNTAWLDMVCTRILKYEEVIDLFLINVCRPPRMILSPVYSWTWRTCSATAAFYCEHVCGGGGHMNNGCSHKLMAGQIRRDNVNKELLLGHLSGRQWARGPLKQPVMGEPICWLYIHTWEVDRQRERDRWGMGGTTVNKCVCNQTQWRKN